MSSVSNSSYRYRLVDVFTQEPFKGNQLAVFLDARGLDDALMQSIARELNLPEVTFVFPPSLAGCVSDVRIFTPAQEMRFAGHPTIGTAFVLRDESVLKPSIGEFRLQEKVGPVPVRVDPDTGIFWLQTPVIHWGEIYDPIVCAKALGLRPDDLVDGVAPQRLSAGNPTLFVAVKDSKLVDSACLSPDGMRIVRGAEPEPFCVFVFAVTRDGAYSRMFAPDYGIPEDPATGSATGPLAAFMKKHGLTSRNCFVSEQGTQMGRRSVLHVQIHSTGIIEVGGYVTPIGEGCLQLGQVRSAALFKI